MTNTKLATYILQNVLLQYVNKAFVCITDWTSPLRSYKIARTDLATVKKISTQSMKVLSGSDL